MATPQHTIHHTMNLDLNQEQHKSVNVKSKSKNSNRQSEKEKVKECTKGFDFKNCRAYKTLEDYGLGGKNQDTYLAIAQMTNLKGEYRDIPRIAKRNKTCIMKWLDDNYDKLIECLPQMVFQFCE